MSVKLGYLVSRYPAVSHTFILREISELRRLGFCIGVASINGLDRPEHLLTEEERVEAASTFYVKRAGAAGALRSHAAALLHNPAAYIKGLWFAVRLGRTDPRSAGLCFFYFVEAAMVGEWMRGHGMRHLHVHFATPAATVAMIAAKLFGFSFSISVHGPDEFYDVPGYLLAKKIEASLFLCAIGTFARSQLMRISDSSIWSKIQIAPLGVDPEVFSPRPFRTNPDIFEVICVGRLVPGKGQHILIAAIGLLLAQGRRVRLRLVGDGPDRPSLEFAVRQQGLENDIVFEGAVNQDRIRDFYRTADAFCLASFAEGIPVVLMEAMAMEIPCVSTYITGIPELIRDSIDGLLVGPSDKQGLVDAIRCLMDDPGLRKRLGQAGRARVMEKYNLRRNTRKLADIFDVHLNAPALRGGA